jgi:hypothetical protein
VKLSTYLGQLPASRELALALKLLAWCVLAWILYRTLDLVLLSWDFTTDDAYITLRYARHLAEGHGIVWNPGEPPVEGYSNFLFVVLGAVADAAGLEALTTLKVISVASLCGTCLLLYRLARTWCGPLLATAPAFLLSGYLGTIYWAVSGLETTVYQLFLVASVTLVVSGLGHRPVPVQATREAPPRGPYRGRAMVLASLSAVLAALTRPEGPVVFLCIALGLAGHVALIWRRVPSRDELRPAVRAAALFVAPFVVLFGLYFAWRLATFGRLFPNSVYCKLGWENNPTSLIDGFWAVAAPALLLTLVYPLRRLDLRHWLIWSLTVAYCLIHYDVDPIIGSHIRHFLGVYALLLVGAAVGLAGVLGVIFPRAGRHRELAALLVLLLFYLPEARLEETVREPLRKNLAYYAPRQGARARVADWLNHHLRRDEWFVVGDCGLIPYRARSKVIDAYCLNSREMTSPPISGSTERYVAWIYRKRPQVLVVHSYEPHELWPRGEYDLYPQLVEHPDFRRRYRYLTTIGAPEDGFHYWIYGRKDRFRR